MDLSPPSGPDDFKLLIVSTPRTGNTWVKHLVAAAYEAPIGELDLTLDLGQLAALGRRWVAHQHYFPYSHLLNWLQAHRVTTITTVRHPADILVSLYHYVRNFADTDSIVFDDDLRKAMLATPTLISDQATDGSVAAYVRDRFFSDLLLSIGWLRTGRSHRVRYEDLWRDPVATFRELTDCIRPLPIDAIERAVEQCDIENLRRSPGEDPKFFRKGSVGDWREELAPGIIDLLRTQEPYPTLFAALGYTLDPADPLIAAPAQPRTCRNPFRGVTHFDNGVPVSATIVRLFLSVDSAASQRWQPVTATDGPDTFFRWANGAAARDPDPSHPVLITILAAFVHGTRVSLQVAYPDLFGQHRADYGLWFVLHGSSSCEVDDAFVRPMRDRLRAWATAPAGDDPHPGEPAMLTELAACLHRMRPDLQAAFPDPYRRDRLRYVLWFLRHAPAEHGLDPAFVQPVRDRLYAWATGPADDPRAHAEPVVITALAAAIHQDNPALQSRFPDLYGRDRLDYVIWLLDHGRLEYWVESAFLIPIIRTWAEPTLIHQVSLA